MKRFVLFLILLCFLFSGCATARRKQYVQKHPQLDEYHKKAILGGSICKGMTAEEVIVSWGQPDKWGKAGFFSSAEIEWIYYGEWHYDRFGDFTELVWWRHIFFRKGKVVSWKKRLHWRYE
ncbi:MAG: hypothetical protein P9X22_02100 [Candidatus Zapsychrus exili]|nr:hypothetical protein [Candidatus Zapsychrus exili]